MRFPAGTHLGRVRRVRDGGWRYRSVSSVVRVPPELDAFVRLSTPQSLILRGPPGSGKTMLSLAMLESFPGRRVYVSLRVTRQALLDQIPWLGRLPPGEVEIVDAATELDHIQLHARPMASSDDAALKEDELTQDESEFLWLPSAVQSAWSLTDPARPTLVIFDSWDAIIDQYFERGVRPGEAVPSRSEIERKLLARMSRGNITLVLVLERDAPSVLDYHVNGIVETFRQSVEGRLERWLGLPKLRGVSIGTDLYPFTLAQGKFAAITPSVPGERYRLEPPVVDPDPDAPGAWPGSTDYAEGVGRLKPGELTLLELDSAVPREIPRVLIGPMLLHALGSGGRALLIPSPSIDPEDAYLGLRHHISAETLNDNMRVLSTVPPTIDPGELSRMFVPLHRIGWAKSGPAVPVPEDPAFLHRAQDSEHPNLIVVYLSGLQALADVAGVALSSGVLAGLQSAVFPMSRVHVIIVGRSGDPRLEVLGPVIETHLRIRCPHGRVFLNGHRPYLAPLVLSQQDSGEPFRLTPVL
jgi:KaiC/GvpD/RAD55 family RecA-like ATPase